MSATMKERLHSAVFIVLAAALVGCTGGEKPAERTAPAPAPAAAPAASDTSTDTPSDYSALLAALPTPAAWSLDADRAGALAALSLACVDLE